MKRLLAEAPQRPSHCRCARHCPRSVAVATRWSRRPLPASQQHRLWRRQQLPTATPQQQRPPQQQRQQPAAAPPPRVEASSLDRSLLLAPTPATYNPKPQGGFTPLSTNRGCLLQCMTQAAIPEATLDEDYLKLQDHYLNTAAGYHVASIAMKAKETGVSPDVLQPKLWRLASAHWLNQKHQRFSVEQKASWHLAAPQQIAYVEHSSYDETPMKASFDEIEDLLDEETPEPSPGAAFGSLDDLLVTKQLSKLFRHNTSTVKMLQTKASFGMVLHVGGEYVHLLGQTVCPLQIMERGTAEVLQACLHRNSAVSSWVTPFRWKARSVCTDKAGYNIKAEKSITQNRPQSWSNLHIHCEVHCTSTCFQKTYESLVPHEVSGLIRCALALRQPSVLNTFRTCLKEEIRKRLVIKRGAPPLDAVQHRQQLLDTFLTQQSRQGQVHRLLLAKLPNGDWRNRSEVHYFVGPSDNALQDADQIAEMLETGLVYCMCSSKPHLWPRHRWTGADVAVDELARIEAVHGLLSATFPRMMLNFSKPAPALHQGQQAEDPMQPPSEPSPAAQLFDRTFAHEATAASTDHAEGLSERPDQVGGGEAEAEEARSAAQHSQDRRQAATWLKTDPLAHLILMRLTMEPLRLLLQAQLAVVSEEWELEQRVASLASTASTSGSGAPRAHMITEAAFGRLEARYFERLEELWRSSRSWSVVPTHHLTVEYRALAFRVLSRQGALVHQLIGHVHQQFPFALFKLLERPDLADELRSVPPCRKDAWTISMEETFPDHTDVAFHQTLKLHAELQNTNIANIEARHASIRRQLTARSVQTWALKMTTASAEWVFQNIRRHKFSQLQGSRSGPRLTARKTRARVVWTLVTRQTWRKRAPDIPKCRARISEKISYLCWLAGVRTVFRQSP